jgi:hypothetical protein
MCNDTSDFYYMVSEWYKKNPELGLKVCDEGDCNSNCSLIANDGESDSKGEVGVEAEMGEGMKIATAAVAVMRIVDFKIIIYMSKHLTLSIINNFTSLLNNTISVQQK